MCKATERQCRGTVKADTSLADACRGFNVSAKDIVRIAKKFGMDAMEMAQNVGPLVQMGTPMPIAIETVTRHSSQRPSFQFK